MTLGLPNWDPKSRTTGARILPSHVWTGGMRVPFSLAGAVDLFFATSPSAHCFPPSKDHQLRTTSSSGPLPTTMSVPSSPTISWPDSMRLPAYRASYLGRYHPYPRTRTPAREVVMRVAESRPSEDNVAEENVNTGNT